MKKNFSKGMVDVSEKSITKRTAVASSTITLGRQAFDIFLKEGSPKGDILETARVAGIMAAKNTPQIVPLCHPLELGKAKIHFSVDNKKRAIHTMAEVNCCGRTGVEMEALTAVSAAALTIYDMMKWADQNMVISDIKLLKKSGGQSGDFIRKEVQ